MTAEDTVRGYLIPCPRCKKLVFRRPCEIKQNRRYCSRFCYEEDRKRQYIKKVCYVCDKEFECIVAIQHRYTVCSIECRRKRNKLGIHKMICIRCGVEFTKKKRKERHYQTVFVEGVGWMSKHKYVYESFYKCCIMSKWADINHKDGNPKNNTPENLEGVMRPTHVSFHQFLRKLCDVCVAEIDSKQDIPDFMRL